MTKVYIGSVAAFAGKNLFCIGLGRQLLDDGYSLGFMKPYGASPQQINGDITDADAWMISQTLGLNQKPEQCCPVLRTQDLLSDALNGHTGDLLGKVNKACNNLGKNKDVLLLSGAGTLRSGAMMGIGGYQLALELGAKTILVERYGNDFFLDDILSAAYRLGDNLAGVIINAVDREMNAALQEQIIPYLVKEGVPTLGVLAQDELLSAVPVGLVSEMLGAKPLTALRFMDRLIKRAFIGAMQVSHVGKFFSGAHDFACLVGGDRPDMQMAAIEAGAACIILTGNFYPSDLIMARAEEREVTILVVREDTYTVAQTLELIRKRGSLRGPEKIEHGIQLVKDGVDFKALYKAVGLPPKKEAKQKA